MAKKKSKYGGVVLGRINDSGKAIPYIQDDEEIAPVSEKNKSGFFKSSDAADNWSLSTGNGLLDAMMRINAGVWGTTANAVTNVARGATSSIEGIGDFAQNRIADIQDLTGHSKAAEKTRRKSEETWGINQGIDKFNQAMNTTSILGEKSEGVFQGVGTSVLAMGAGALGGAIGGTSLAASIGSLAPLGIGAAGSSENEARLEMMADMKEKGYTTKQINDTARMYGVLSGVGETLSEMMFGGIAQGSQALGIGKGIFDSADDAVINALTQKMRAGLAKNLVQAGLKASSEGVEEVVSGFLNAAAKKATYMKEEDFGKLLEDEKLLDSFISGTLSAAITQVPSVARSTGLTPSRGFKTLNNNEIRDFITNLNTQEQQVVEKEIENRLAQEKNPTKKRRIEIEKQVIEDLDRGYISANIIRDTLGENYNAERDVRLNESFNEEARRSQAYENDLSKYDEKQRKVIQTAIDSGLLNNSNKTHDFVDLIAKISADKDIDFDFTNNERINESGFGIKGKTVNGYVKDGTINLNLESNQALNKTVGHEITHVLEGMDLYNSLQDSLKSFIGEREWNNRISELEKTYKNVKGANIENELTSDLVGEYVFNDESFVRSLSTKNPNLFQKIFDEIKYMVKIATAGSKEARDLEKVKRAFEKAYRETSKTQKGTQYSASEEDLEKYVYPDQVYEAYKNEDKSKITQTIEELEEYKKTLDTETDEGWSENFNTNAKIKALENGYESVYDYYVGEEKKRLRQEVEGEYGRGYRALQEGIQNEKKNNQLQQDIAESTDFKNAQFQVIQNNNPMFDDYHVGIRSPKDIKTFSQAIEDEESFAWGDYTKEDAERDLARDRVTIYSSYPIKQGVFVSTSRIQAEQYAGGEGNQVYSKTVRPEKVAWISGDEGQYASVRNKFTEDIKYSLSVQEANTGTDNQGRQLSEGQMVRFGNSKTTDDDGNLVTVYHTTTNEVAQFNEFNPVGTPYYRFGDQVVNYFSDSKDMSGSYASQDYKAADTKKLNNVEEAQEYLSQISEETGNLYTLYQDEKGKWNLSQDKRLSREARDFLNSLSEEERQEMKDKIFTDDKMMEYDPDYAKVFSWNEFNKDLQSKYKSVTDKYIGSTDIVELQKEMINYLENPSWLKFENEESGTGIGYYDTEDQMLKNIKHDIQDTNMSKKSKIQYEGYVNITNPYIVDAEKRNWNQVVQQSNEFIDELDERVPQDVKDNLVRLFQESLNKSDEVREEYNAYQHGIDNIYSSLNTPYIGENVRNVKRILGRIDADNLENYFRTGETNSNLIWAVSETLEDYGIIDYIAAKRMREEFTIPENWRNYLEMAYNEEFDTSNLNTDALNKYLGEKTSLKELYNKRDTLYEDYDRYRLEDSYFIEQLQEGNVDVGEELSDILETRAEIMGADAVAKEIAEAAKNGFSKPQLIRTWGTSKTTNDIVKEVIASNKDGTTNYDGIIFKNVYDYGGKAVGETQAHDVFVTFNSNQFKAVDNLNPTDDADIRYQLGNNEVAPTSGWNVRSEDVRLQSAFQDTIAPLQEQVQQLTDTITRLEDRIAPLNEQEADELYQETQRGFENEAAPIRENLTPEENRRMDVLDLLERNNMLTEEQRYEREQLQNKENPVNVDDEVTVGQSLEDVRDINKVGSPKVKSYQYEHPEVKPYFQQEARGMLSDLNNSQKGERYKVTSNAYDGHIIEQEEWKGVPRFTSPQIAELLDSKWGYTYKDIEKGLNAIIEDHGAENIAIAKRIEFILDDNLRNGYTDWQTGMEVPPNQDYLNMLKQQEWENYFDDLNNQYPLEQNIPQYNIDEETDFSDVKIDKDLQDMTADDINLEPFLQGMQDLNDLKNERQQLKNEIEGRKEVYMPKNADRHKAWNAFKTMFVNEFAVTDDFAKRVHDNDIKFKGDTYNNWQALAETNIETAQTDINGNAIGRSVDSIWSEADRLGVREILDEYLKHWSNIDRSKQGKGGNYKAKESYKKVQEIKEQHPEVHRLAKDCWQLYRNARHNLRDAGIINQDTSDRLGAMYPHYNPYISENIEQYFTDKGELKPKGTIKRAKGGAVLEELMTSQEAMQYYIKSQFNTTTGNDFFREIVKASNEQVKLTDDRTSFVNADNLYTDENGYYLTAYEDGEPISAKISKEMYDTLSRDLKHRVNNIEHTFSPVTKALQKLSNLRRNILTSWSPTFIPKNAIKDIQEAVINSKYTTDMLANWKSPKMWYELAKGTGDAGQFRNLYGSGLTMGQYDIDLDNYNPSAKNLNFLKGIKNANELIELAPRYAEFKASLKNGCSLQEAMYNAREVTTNFSRGGVITKALNRNGFTFLNSSVQGFDKFIRNFSGENGAKGIVNSLAKAAIFGIAPAMFNELAFGWGDDKDEEYEALPDYIKDNYYIIKRDNGEFIRIPKGRVLSVFGSAARRTLEALQGEENAFEGYLGNVQNQIGINNPEENNIFAPLLQAMGGRKLDSGQTAGSAWYGGDIIPSRLQKERPEDQYDASIDWLSTQLGQLTGISPYKINYVLDQYTGGIGDLLIPMGTSEANSDGSIIAPIKDQFTADTITDNKYVSEFYDTKGKLYTGSKATDEDVLKNKYMNSISSEMAKLYAERREVQASDLSKKEKYAKSQEIKAEINRLAKEGMDNYNNVIMSNNYAKIGDTEYYKNANGQWTKVTDDVASLGLDAEEKSEYYKVKNDIYTTKKENDGNDKPLVVQDIINSNLTPDAKVSLYTSNYKDDLIQPLVDSGMDVDSYLTYKSQNFTADKDSNGKSISGSKKRKVFDYINSMNIPYEQKLILAKSEYNSFNDNNYEILEYINNSPMTYDEKMTLISNLGFKVDGNNVSW